MLHAFLYIHRLYLNSLTQDLYTSSRIFFHHFKMYYKIKKSSILLIVPPSLRKYPTAKETHTFFCLFLYIFRFQNVVVGLSS